IAAVGKTGIAADGVGASMTAELNGNTCLAQVVRAVGAGHHASGVTYGGDPIDTIPCPRPAAGTAAGVDIADTPDAFVATPGEGDPWYALAVSTRSARDHLIAAGVDLTVAAGFARLVDGVLGAGHDGALVDGHAWHNAESLAGGCIHASGIHVGTGVDAAGPEHTIDGGSISTCVRCVGRPEHTGEVYVRAKVDVGSIHVDNELCGICKQRPRVIAHFQIVAQAEVAADRDVPAHTG